MNRFYRAARFAGASAVLLLAACGSGGSSDLSNAPGISVSPSSLSFSAVHNGLLPPTWVDYTNQSRLAGSGTHWTYTAVIISTALAFGTYATTLQIGIADSNQN